MTAARHYAMLSVFPKLPQKHMASTEFILCAAVQLAAIRFCVLADTGRMHTLIRNRDLL